MTLMTITPFMSYATEGGPFDVPISNSEVTADGDESNVDEPPAPRAEVPVDSSTETKVQDTRKEAPDSSDNADKEEIDNEDKIQDEPTEVIVVDSVEDLSAESDAEYGNDAFFTIDAAKDDSANLATDEVSENVTDILSGDGSTSEKKEEILSKCWENSV